MASGASLDPRQSAQILTATQPSIKREARESPRWTRLIADSRWPRSALWFIFADSMKKPRVVPVILAAGPSPRLGFPKALARFGRKTALKIALANCAGLASPIVVLGYQSARVRPLVPRRAQTVLNRNWRTGQLNSVLTGLRCVPKNSAFLIYPVDHPLLRRSLISRLVAAFQSRKKDEKIFMPRFRGRAGHPVVLAPELRSELRGARTAREVVYRDLDRIHYVRVHTATIWEDFDDPASYRRCLRRFQRK